MLKVLYLRCIYGVPQCCEDREYNRCIKKKNMKHLLLLGEIKGRKAVMLIYIRLVAMRVGLGQKLA